MLAGNYLWYGAYGFGPSAQDRAFLEAELGSDTPVDDELSDGDVLDLGDGWMLEVLHLPGHTPGHLGLWDPRSRSAIVIDAVLDRGIRDRAGTLLIPPRIYDTVAYAATIERLEALGAERLLTAHFPVDGETGAFLERSRAWDDGGRRGGARGRRRSAGAHRARGPPARAVPEFGHRARGRRARPRPPPGRRPLKRARGPPDRGRRRPRARIARRAGRVLRSAVGRRAAQRRRRPRALPRHPGLLARRRRHADRALPDLARGDPHGPHAPSRWSPSWASCTSTSPCSSPTTCSSSPVLPQADYAAALARAYNAWLVDRWTSREARVAGRDRRLPAGPGGRRARDRALRRRARRSSPSTCPAPAWIRCGAIAATTRSSTPPRTPACP